MKLLKLIAARKAVKCNEFLTLEKPENEKEKLGIYIINGKLFDVNKAAKVIKFRKSKILDLSRAEMLWSTLYKTKGGTWFLYGTWPTEMVKEITENEAREILGKEGEIEIYKKHFGEPIEA